MQDNKETNENIKNGRRKFLKKAVYSVPTVIGMGYLIQPTEAHAGHGYGGYQGRGRGHGYDQGPGKGPGQGNGYGHNGNHRGCGSACDGSDHPSLEGSSSLKRRKRRKNC